MIEAEPLPRRRRAGDPRRPTSGSWRRRRGDTPVAVRSSATAEDTEAASFAGMNETFLNVRGADDVVEAVRRCWASLFGARTVYYRAKRGFGQADMDIAVVVQRQIPSTRAGVMFTIDPASGRHRPLVIEGIVRPRRGGRLRARSPRTATSSTRTDLAILAREVRRKELVIEPQPGGGTATRELGREEAAPPVLSDDEVRELADLGRAHRGALRLRRRTPSGLRRRRRRLDAAVAPGHLGRRRQLGEPGGRARRRDPARAASAPRPASARGRVRRRHRRSRSADEPRRGRRPRHAHDRARLGAADAPGGGDRHRLRRHDLPRRDRLARARDPLRRRHRRRDARSCATASSSPSTPRRASSSRAPTAPAAAPAAGRPRRRPAPAVTATKLLVNLSEPSQVDRAAALDVDGVGLLRAELMVLEALEGRHPRLLLEEGRGEEFVDADGRGAETVSPPASRRGRSPTGRSTSARNEFRGLEGGEHFEPEEANPMIGYRGALRYMREPELFGLELDAIRRVWDAGHTNLHVMLPFVRTRARARRAAATRSRDAGLLDRPGFELWVMAEVPSVLFHLRALRRARDRRHLDRLQRPDPAAARRRPRLRAASPRSSTSATRRSPTTCGC